VPLKPIRLFRCRPHPASPSSARHLKMRHMTAAPVLRPFLSTLEQQLKSWDAGGNRVHLAGNIERTIRAIETLRQPAA
jgi:hypothetical protein